MTIVVGYRKEAIQYAYGSRCGELEIKYIESIVFDRTGSAYSLWLAREALLCEDRFLLEGDVFFEEDALRYLLFGEATDVAAVAPFNAFDARVRGSIVRSQLHLRFPHAFSAKLTADGPRPFKTLKLLRLSAMTLRAMIVPALDDIIGSGAKQADTEELFADLVERRGLRLATARCDDLRWYEIDSTEDLRIAERIFARAKAFGVPNELHYR
ncbi:phosphocholine cytidylyltransferase family protein [Bradyrhizobium sp. CB3481]|uniref:phosphocholine cytidylyltransferase family protein n=1 Tax=Bradyrhizobium sp. CB3481 TaxID=3039158 RepID=UPI0032C20F7C